MSQAYSQPNSTFSWLLLTGMAKPNGMVRPNVKAGRACFAGTAACSAGIPVTFAGPGSWNYNPGSGFLYWVLLPG